MAGLTSKLIFCLVPGLLPLTDRQMPTASAPCVHALAGLAAPAGRVAPAIPTAVDTSANTGPDTSWYFCSRSGLSLRGSQSCHSLPYSCTPLVLSVSVLARLPRRSPVMLTRAAVRRSTRRRRRRLPPLLHHSAAHVRSAPQPRQQRQQQQKRQQQRRRLRSLRRVRARRVRRRRQLSQRPRRSGAQVRE